MYVVINVRNGNPILCSKTPDGAFNLANDMLRVPEKRPLGRIQFPKVLSDGVHEYVIHYVPEF